MEHAKHFAYMCEETAVEPSPTDYYEIYPHYETPEGRALLEAPIFVHVPFSDDAEGHIKAIVEHLDALCELLKC